MLFGTVIVPSVGFNIGVFAPGVLGVAPVTTPMVTVPVVMVKVSGVAVIVGVATVTNAVEVAQLPGFNFSQI